MSLYDELHSDDDLARLRAVENAGRLGDPALVDVLLDRALNDPIDVRTAAGPAERWENISDAAARAVTRLLEPADGVDPRIRAAVRDLAYDDERVAALLHHLGERYEPLRRELETSDEARLRRRALAAVPVGDRSDELTGRFVGDPDPSVRIEAVCGSRSVADRERLLRDPDPVVREAAVDALRCVIDSAAYLDAARAETEPAVRGAFLDGLAIRERTRPVRLTLIRYLDPPGWGVTTRLLATADDAGVAAAIASRILVDAHPGSLVELVGYPHLLTHAPELRATLEHLRRHTPHDPLYRRLGTVLDEPPTAAVPADDLDAAQRDRLRREAERWTAVAVADGAVVDPDRRADLIRLAQLFTARQIRAGVDPLPPRPLSPILLAGSDALTVGLGAGLPPLALALRRPHAVTSMYRPHYAVWNDPCTTCGTSVRFAGELEWLYHDDDRIREWEDGFTGYLAGACAGCGRHRRFEARLSLTVSRFHETSAELTWDVMEERRGHG